LLAIGFKSDQQQATESGAVFTSILISTLQVFSAQSIRTTYPSN